MRISTKTLALLAVWSMWTEGRAYPQSAVDQLQPLVETTAERLVIAEQVALAKWDNGTAVEDAPREAEVMTRAISAGESSGLDQALVSNFFRAQIEANKLVQYALLAEWRRLGKAPDHAPVDLAKTIRPKLDEVQTALIVELAETAGIRARASCRTDIANAVGQYVTAHRNDFNPLRAIAMDRAMAAACS